MGARKMNISIPDAPEFKSEAVELLKAVDSLDGNATARRWIKDILKEAVSRGGLTSEDPNKQVTTNEAADFLQVSRSRLRNVMDAGLIPFVRVGTHRRLKLKDLMVYKKSCEEQEKGLREIARIGEELEDDD